eukprot:7383412-Prymnesium_polylepis.1
MLVDPAGEPVDFVVAILYVYNAIAVMVHEINRLLHPRFIWVLTDPRRSAHRRRRTNYHDSQLRSSAE